LRVTLLGTGTSVGVPRIACDCSVCASSNPRNKRLRCSILMEYADRVILVDTTPDLRAQALRYDIRNIDAVLFTHGHADHLHGLDDIRCYCFGREEPIPCYGDAVTLERVYKVFDYAFDSTYASALPNLELFDIDGRLDLFGLEIDPIVVYHGRMPVLAFRAGSFAYVTDCNSIPSDSMAKLRGVDTLILDALRYKEHPTHFNIDQALAVVEELKPRRTYLTHIAHELDHETTNAALPDGVELAYDGLVLDIH
jgi:phosphoribosyl 1,2-cyclic phosphate phosphodiesterase